MKLANETRREWVERTKNVHRKPRQMNFSAGLFAIDDKGSNFFFFLFVWKWGKKKKKKDLGLGIPLAIAVWSRHKHVVSNS